MSKAGGARKKCMITFDGKTMSITGWAKHLGIASKTLWYRVRRWPIEKALSYRSPAQGVRNYPLARLNKWSRAPAVSHLIKDLTGQRFGWLVVIRRCGSKKWSGQKAYATMWLCRCMGSDGNCGKETEVTRSHLLSGDTKSCGCLRKSPRAVQQARISEAMLAAKAMAT